jgi:hypothetical protein
MATCNLKVDLEERKDKNGNVFYIGKLKCPILVDCKDGISFLIFTSEPGNEQLQIVGMDNDRFPTPTMTRLSKP